MARCPYLGLRLERLSVEQPGKGDELSRVGLGVGVDGVALADLVPVGQGGEEVRWRGLEVCGLWTIHTAWCASLSLRRMLTAWSPSDGLE